MKKINLRMPKDKVIKPNEDGLSEVEKQSGMKGFASSDHDLANKKEPGKVGGGHPGG